MVREETDQTQPEPTANGLSIWMQRRLRGEPELPPPPLTAERKQERRRLTNRRNTAWWRQNQILHPESFPPRR